MDTISRENNSILPLAGVIAGAAALLLAVVALFKLNSAGKEIANLKEDLNSRLMSVENQLSTSASAGDEARRIAIQLRNDNNRLKEDINKAFGDVANELGAIRGELAKAQTARPASSGGSNGGSKAAPVAGPDEYLVKSGDTGVKIAREHGVSLSDLQAVNPDVNWNRLKVNDKIKLPKK
jgi:FOG: LysM repeat